MKLWLGRVLGTGEWDKLQAMKSFGPFLAAAALAALTAAIVAGQWAQAGHDIHNSSGHGPGWSCTYTTPAATICEKNVPPPIATGKGPPVAKPWNGPTPP